IFVGSRPAACKPFLLENHITHVLSIGVGPEEDLSPEITVKKIELEDEAEAKIEDILDEACQFIDEGTTGSNMVLVHCHAGGSQSPAVAINYLHRRKGFSLPCAFFFVSTRRPVMDLNRGFQDYI
ncbi:phosphatases II, partial [Fomitiporia mediterranea MF3/22]|uniref:phosphatases II n=1 Tax=Fomitiporia mediterranea (strain MF3/22) TaxID=694068 RepID=UPI0004408F12